MDHLMAFGFGFIAGGAVIGALCFWWLLKAVGENRR